MRLGVTMFATDQTMDPVELAVEAEARGFGSLWLPEHTHIPTSRLTPPPTGDAELATEYKRTLDPLIICAAIAMRTTTLRFGTGVVLPAQREPIVTAKAVATLQNLAGGRFTLGVGFGWNVDEMADHGVDYRTRRARSREHVLAMQALWTDDEAEFHGEFVDFDPCWSWPKPEVPVPVIIGGGAGPKMFSHVCEYSQGWIPIGGAGLSTALPELQARWADAGRDPSTLEVVPFGSIPTPEKLEHFERLGVTEVVFRLPSASRDDVLAILDEQSALLTR
jgi:probable F420-dependent oxidoreductase